MNLKINKAFSSKINWSASALVALNLAASLGVLDPEKLEAVNIAIGALLVIFRTFFTVSDDVINTLEAVKSLSGETRNRVLDRKAQIELSKSRSAAERDLK